MQINKKNEIYSVIAVYKFDMSVPELIGTGK